MIEAITGRGQNRARVTCDGLTAMNAFTNRLRFSVSEKSASDRIAMMRRAPYAYPLAIQDDLREAMEADAAKMPRQKGGFCGFRGITEAGRSRIGAATAARNSARTEEARDDILRLHAEGLCGAEIGKRLGRDPKAVRRLIRSVEAAQ